MREGGREGGREEEREGGGKGGRESEMYGGREREGGGVERDSECAQAHC